MFWDLNGERACVPQHPFQLSVQPIVKTVNTAVSCFLTNVDSAFPQFAQRRALLSGHSAHSAGELPVPTVQVSFRFTVVMWKRMALGVGHGLHYKRSSPTLLPTAYLALLFLGSSNF